MTLNLKKKVTLTASQMLAENNRATADRLTWAAQTDEANLRTALNVPENGLTEEMAEEARDRYGRNVLPTSQRTPLYKRLAAAFINPFTVVLVLLAIFSALTNVAMVDPGDESWATVIIITIMVLISGILRFVQETRSGNVAAKLSEMIHTTVCVTREGEKKEIPLEEIVVGDIVSLSAGDMLPADVRILRAKDLFLSQSSLTGESEPVEKSGALCQTVGSLTECGNLAFMGSTVVSGSATAVVLAVGHDTMLGAMAKALNVKPPKTTFEKGVNSVSWVLIRFMLLMVPIVLLINGLSDGDWIQAGLFAISIAVGLTPEMLPMIVTTSLAKGAMTMSCEKVIIKDLNAIQNLGAMDILCTDKTGTLTQNRMTVTASAGSDERLLATAMALCADAVHDPDTDTVTGEPTEAALVRWAVTQGLSPSALRAQLPRVAEAPFDSARKMMSTLHSGSGHIVQYTKGAPDVLLPLCDRIWIDGQAVPMTEEHRAEIAAHNRDMTGRALRVLAAAMRTYDALPDDTSPAALEQHLCFLGLAGMIDPVRPEVVDAIRDCRSAGIRPIMITGDHVDTASAIARELGLLGPGDEAVTGAELGTMDDDTFRRRLQHISVYARVQPEHKTRIVQAWRDAGFITAMTGDGVNDAPSIRAADIGIGMGITGTDVTKNVADMVLADDNFATIVGAVEEGRRIYDNIRRAVKFLLGSNMSEVLSIFAATMLGFTILEPVHLLWINLLTDCFPALALGMERAEPDIMTRPPRSARESIFAHGVGFDCVYQGVMCAVLTLAAFFIGHYMEYGVWTVTNSPDGTTMAFLTLSMAEIFHSFNMRAHRASLFTLRTPNWALVGAAAASLALTTLCIYVPFLANAFDFTPISAAEYAVAMGLAFLVLPIVEGVKCVQRAAAKRAARA